MMVESTISADAATASVSDKSTATTRATTSKVTAPPTVCVIGGGPGALFFCHALETQKKLLLAKGEDISHFPGVVKCFERSPGPGGVWRSDRTHGDKKKSETTKNVNVNMSAMEDDDDDDDESSVIASSTVNEINSLDVSMDNNDVMDSSMSSASSVDSVEYQHHHLDLILSSPSLCPKNKKQRMLDINTDNDHDEKKAVDKTVETSTLTTATSLTASSSSLSLTSGETDEGGGGGVVAEEGGGAAAPGAIAIATTTGHEPKTNMYSALWTNGAKEAFEFYDYTFVDHFGVEVAAKLPTFLPRKLVLEYLLARCTHKCPTFFDKYFSFHTTVLNVKYVAADEDDDDAQEQKQAQHKNKFQLTLQDETTGLISIEYYDKCIWAGGNEGVPSIPKTTEQLFENAKNNKCTTTTTTTTSNSSNNNSGSSSTINSSSSSSSSGSSSINKNNNSNNNRNKNNNSNNNST